MAQNAQLINNHTGTGPLSLRVVIAVSVFLGVAGLLGLDAICYQASIQYFNTDLATDRDLNAITRPFWFLFRVTLGHPIGGVAAYLAILLLHRHGWRLANRCLLVVAPTLIFAQLVKMSVGRLRPDTAQHLFDARPFAAFVEDNVPICFPSGEATTAFAIAAALALTWPRLAPWLMAAATFTALARFLPGDHYLSDVAAGALIGVGGVLLLTPVVDRLLGSEPNDANAEGAATASLMPE